jgi:hypothetical protein
MWRRRRKSTGFVEVDGGVVGWFSGGEPVDGCDLVSVLVFAPSDVEARDRVEAIGLWSAYLMDEFGEPDRRDVEAAVADPEGFVWNHADGGDWLPSAELPRREQGG